MIPGILTFVFCKGLDGKPVLKDLEAKRVGVWGTFSLCTPIMWIINIFVSPKGLKTEHSNLKLSGWGVGAWGEGAVRELSTVHCD